MNHSHIKAYRPKKKKKESILWKVGLTILASYIAGMVYVAVGYNLIILGI